MSGEFWQMCCGAGIVLFLLIFLTAFIFPVSGRRSRQEEYFEWARRHCYQFKTLYRFSDGDDLAFWRPVFEKPGRQRMTRRAFAELADALDYARRVEIRYERMFLWR